MEVDQFLIQNSIRSSILFVPRLEPRKDMRGGTAVQKES